MAIAAAAAWMLSPAIAAAQDGHVRAGAASVDASWHVGASAGQYASDCAPSDFPDVEPPASDNCTFVHPTEGNFDPTAHSVRRGSSYGVQSRLSVRAVVIEGPDPDAGGPLEPARVAIAKTDLYIPQDLVYRRAAQLMQTEGDCGITPQSFTMTVTHNHSSPFYSSTSWGVWAFQDIFDVRFYNYMAERMFEAVEAACDDLVPVRVGAAVTEFDKTHRHSFGPAVADDGTPAGYPNSDTDHELTVIRLDDVSVPGDPEPLANIVNYSLHPEFLEGNDLISADYLGPFERMMDRETEAITVWTQGAVGTSEPERSSYHPVSERLEFSHRDYAQAEYGARLMADAALATWDEAGGAASEIPFDTSFPVAIEDRWYPGPFSHPYPTVSNCRTDKGLTDPALPVVGLPTCQSAGFDLQQGLLDLSESLGLPVPSEIVPGTDPGLNTDDFQALGVPVPENYSAPSYTGLQEDIDIHLQGIRLGDIYLPVCSCEQWFDQSENIETRTDTVVGNEHLGYDWGAQCTPNPDGTHLPDGSGTGSWSCPDPHSPSQNLPPVSDHEYARMRAQVNNAANGWNDAENAVGAESEPSDPTEIRGNYAHDDRCGPTPLTPGDEGCGGGGTPVSANLGYELTVPISMANDYNGYIATYREYQRGDHYRKALTGWGPHSSDYMASRLVSLGRLLQDSEVVLPTDQVQEQLLVAKAELDTAINDQRAEALGETGGAAIAAYEAGLPDDGGNAEALEQPEDIERFEAAFFAWNGGSNFTDNPQVRVERLVGGQWEDYADQSGEVPVTLEFPQTGETPAYTMGDQTWEWTAHFEAFVSQFPTGAPSDGGAGPQPTPSGTYRFVVDGMRREGGQAVPYHLESDAFEVAPWSGITVEGFRLERDGTMSFRVGPRHTYEVTGGGNLDGVTGPDISDQIGPVDYPDSYESPARYIRDERDFKRDPAAPGDPERLEWFCLRCSWRAWLDEGDASVAEVVITDVDDGSVETVAATERGGRWVTERTLGSREIAYVVEGGVRDEWQNYNAGSAGPLFVGSEPPVPPPGQPPIEPPIDPPIDPGPLPVPPLGEPGHCGDTQSGTEAPDTLIGALGSELILGLDGDDEVKGGDGDDCIHGGPGDDRLSGEGGADLVEGNDGRDVVRGGDDGDRLDGGNASDVVRGGKGDDFVESRGNGRDLVRCGPGADRALVGKIDRVRGCEKVRRGRS